MNAQIRPRGIELVQNPRWVEAANWRRLEKEKDGRARQRLFEKYLPFAKKMAFNQFRQRRPDNFELADVEQWAIEALLICIDRYDPYRCVPFPAFARRRIVGNIADGIASMSEIGRQVSYVYQNNKDRLTSLKQETGHEQDPLAQLKELAVGLAVGLMLEGTGMYENDEQPATDPSAYEGMIWKSTIQKLAMEYERLPDPQSFIIKQHYQNGISFSQIATLLGLSKGRISQLHRSALQLLKKRLGKF